MQLPAVHLPARFADAAVRPFDARAGVAATTATLAPADVEDLCRGLIAARAALADVPVARVIDAIDRAASRLCDSEGPERGPLLQGLAAFTGFSPAMAALVLDRMSEDWRAPALERLVHAELGGPAAIEGFVRRADGARARAVAPPLGLHVFAGNVPGVSITSMVRALLVRSAVLGKPAAGEPFLAAAFARLLAEQDPVLGACCAILYWPGGSTDIEDAVLRHAGLVIHYGGAAAIEALQARTQPGVRFIEHGPRVSVAVIHADAAGDDAARDLATAVALFDQQGCVSPQAVWVLGSADAARDFAARTAARLRDLATDLPRGRIDTAEAAAIHQLRTRAEFRAIAGADTLLWGGPSLSYTVIYDNGEEVTGSCLNRTLIVRPVASIQQLLDALRPVGPALQTVGIDGFDGDEREALAAALAEIGASRITTISAMPWPPVTWHHDGRGPLRELVRWVDLED